MADKQNEVNQVQMRIEHAAQAVARNPAEITLVAVSKTKPIEDLVAAYEAGIRHFGENRAEELAEKAQALQHLTDIHWHFIGHLQSRQSKPVADYAECFHAVDRVKIAERLSQQLQERERTLAVYIEVNISGEENKGGFTGVDWENNAEQRAVLQEAVQTIMALPHLKILGLMTMAPFRAPEAEIRSIFQRLRGLSVWLNQALPTLNAHGLSMGMSGDFEIGIAEGATCVRVGSAIFGGR